MKRTLKILLILSIIFSILAIGVVSYGKDADREFLTGLEGTVPSSTGSVQGIGNSIIKIVRTVGMVLAVGIIFVIGIKYMMGSAEEKADYKKSMIPYIVGAVLLFSASAIVGVINDLALGLK